jgi:hypothetical protein
MCGRFGAPRHAICRRKQARLSLFSSRGAAWWFYKLISPRKRRKQKKNAPANKSIGFAFLFRGRWVHLKKKKVLASQRQKGRGSTSKPQQLAKEAEAKKKRPSQ